ncbi:hypothetical protein L202_04183 [Cryptococcus amylolentus CBS 6039]|uniref:Arrestin C-terminal-like domain-containing protein n=1 Tax=Cryptococcus amylolentus CBS 6039 TaxID=1295533 RepID=A0A1E3HR14_9TREE|nr:hypothetical protein L202_04183 [Cryptococcus amylolentus CBS 6039]ODN78575.1 hypothetical protein L202_04183 [Cryptococcus amylolentus CBS 6039]
MVKNNQPLQIRLTEPVIFLKGPSTGLDFRGRPQAVRQDGQPAMVRGLLTLRLSKPTRIRSIAIKLEGKARTEWPEGIGAKRMETSEEHVILIDQATFFNAYQHDSSRSRSTRRALSLGPGVNVGRHEDDIDDDVDLQDVPRDDDADDWVNIGRGRQGRGRNPVRSSSAMPGTHDSSSWHRDGFSRRPSFDNSARSSMLDMSGLSMRDRGPSPAYTPTASPTRVASALPGHVSRPSSLRQSVSPHLAPSRGPALSPIASAAPSQNNSERGDSAEAEHRRPVYTSTLTSEYVREETDGEPRTPTAPPQDDSALDEGIDESLDLPRPILESRANSSSYSHGEVRFSVPAGEAAGGEGLPMTDEPAALETPAGTPPVSGGGRAASVRTFDSTHSASSTSLSSAQDHSGGENHPVSSAIQPTSGANTPAPSAPPSIRQMSMDGAGRPRSAASRPGSILSSRQPSDQNLHNLGHRASGESLRGGERTRTARAGSTSTIVEDTASTFSPAGSSRPSSRSRTTRGASGTPAIHTAPNLAHLAPSAASSESSELSDDGRGRKNHKFSLAATLRGLSRDVKERVSHGGRHHSKSRSRMDNSSRAELHETSDSPNSSAFSSIAMPMSRANSSTGPGPIDHAHGSRHGSLVNDDFVPTYGRGGAGSTRRSRSRERDSSTVRGRDDERSRSRARGRHMGMKVLTDKLGLGETEDQGDDVHNWKEFRKGKSHCTYNYPISFPIPVNAPPTIHAEFGSVMYRLKASVVRVGALTPNLTEDTEIVMIATPQEDDLEETENVIVERQWEEQMRYQITLGGKAFPIAGTIPISIRLMPLLKCKIHRLTVALEEKTDYHAQERKVARHETPKRFVLLFIKQADAKERTEPLLPIISDDPTAAERSPLAEMARQAAMSDPPSDLFDLERDPDDAMYASLMEPTGPWHLEKDLQLPDCVSKIKFTTKHDQTNITVAHWLKVTIRVERGDDEALDSKGRRKQFDIIIETPIKILDCRVNPSYNSLPTYSVTQRNFVSTPGICSVHNTKSAPPVPIGMSRHSSSNHAGEAHVAGTPPTTLSSLPEEQPHGHLLPHLSSHRRTEVEPVGSAPTTPGVDGEDTLLERNIVYDRLMSGQVTETGEVPPTYVEAMAEAVGDRSVSRVRESEASATGRGVSSSRGSRSSSRLRD